MRGIDVVTTISLCDHCIYRMEDLLSYRPKKVIEEDY